LEKSSGTDMQKILAKEHGVDNIDLPLRLMEIFTIHTFEMGNPG
jgi:hypothetical protein